MKVRYFKDNDSYFKFIKKNIDRIKNLQVNLKNNNIKIKYEILTQK